MDKLAQFDPEGCCPKCGHDKIETRYQGHIENDPCWYERKFRPVDKWPDHEYIRRTCERCRYDWPEAVNDREQLETRR